jgi:N6-L-threonylcarbamoyladenine synthase
MSLVLGLESSCDETSAAVVRDGRRVLSNRIATQIPIHARYGGVVPELASRNHVVEILPVITACLEEAGVTLRDLDGVAVTAGPGLVGSLLVGVELAKALAFSLDLPLVGVNHIEAHLMAPLLEDDNPGELSGTPRFPFVGLVVSGGHTHLYRVDGVGQYRTLGATRDDAAGEAFDKVAKMLGLPYPGGVQIDRAARRGDPGAVAFPRALKQRESLDFSFSGLKTAVLTWLQRRGEPLEQDTQAFFDLCASFQEAVVDSLTTKLFRAAQVERVSDVVISGGVSANSRLRERALELSRRRRLRLHIPPIALCTDNAAMIAGLGSHYLPPRAAGFHQHRLNASPLLPMGPPAP